MWLSSVRSWLQGAGKPPLRGRRPRRTCRPGLEVLEDRAVPAGTFTVTNVADAGPGSLREAIGQANEIPNDADTIVFQSGLTGTIVLTTGQLAATGPVSILGPGSGLLTIDGNHQSRIFELDNGSPTLGRYELSGLTLTRGQANNGVQHGGAIEVASETLILRDVVIANNFASGVGGGIFVGPDSLLLMDDCTVDHNTAATGAGLSFFDGSAAFIRTSTISGNSAVGGSAGGGIFYGRGPGLAIENSTISGNTAGENGGGIRVFGGPVRIVNSTIAFNTADSDNTGGGQGGGIFSGRFGGLPVTLESTIVADNAVGTTGQSPDISGEVIADFCLVENTAGMVLDSGSNNLTNVDPRLDPSLAKNGGPTKTHALLPGSPALNAGINRAALPTDQRGPGFFRTAGPATDIGAFEVQPLASSLPLTVPVVAIRVTRGRRRTRVDVVVDGDLKRRFFPFGAFAGRVRVLQADVNGDGLPDVIARATIHGKKRTRTFLTGAAGL
jgi:hypothetical protein